MTFTRRRFLERSAAAVALLGAGTILGAPSPAKARSRLTPAQLRALRDAVRGQVLAPGASGYDAARVVFNAVSTACARPRWCGRAMPRTCALWRTGPGATTWRWSRVRAVTRTTAHRRATTPSSSTSRASTASRWGVEGIATVGPGARNIDVYAALARRGATVPSGSCPTVGAGGLVTGGGMGLAGRELGLTLDRVVSFDVVTADGQLRRVDAGHDEDLFWALRGGGGSFGIVTAMRLRVRRVSSAAWFFASFPRASADEALAAWDDLAPDAPEALTSIFTVPGGSGAVTALGQYFGSVSSLRRLVAPLAQVRGARLRSGTSGYLALQRRWAGCAEGGLAACRKAQRALFAGSSVYASRPLSASARRDLLAAARIGATLVLDAYGGAIGRVAPGATAFVHRDARFSVQILSYAGDIATARARVARARALIAPHGNGQAYQNYADPGLSGALHAYYGANYERLASVKRAIDPDDRFRIAQGMRSR